MPEISSDFRREDKAEPLLTIFNNYVAYQLLIKVCKFETFHSPQDDTSTRHYFVGRNLNIITPLSKHIAWASTLYGKYINMLLKIANVQKNSINNTKIASCILFEQSALLLSIVVKFFVHFN
ncbi:hypothetical protein T01_735 [Trichinella spiralis]|uniref:Uncharacterized protein n=1 Tax=Trichinella spiralis TaxID=6334 RepID=A0A0V1B821_TRISP|nr:hypothetical protein T01_735 [Trichinella spiralis]